jgi:hypothetical protein
MKSRIKVLPLKIKKIDTKLEEKLKMAYVVTGLEGMQSYYHFYNLHLTDCLNWELPGNLEFDKCGVK